MLQIRLLGQFDIRMDGKRVMIPTRAGQSLFAYLVLTAGISHRREKLAGTFWPDTTEDTARKNLRQELWRIRKAISTQQTTEDEYLLADELTLKFNREAKYWLDVTQMERPDLDLQSLIANLSLYQGELLPGFYDDWIALERERVQAVFDTRAEQLLEQLIAAERWIAVQEWGERWLTLSGVHEPAYRALILASGMRGDMAKVASLYQRCADELMESLGVEPSAETRALYDSLRKGTKTPRNFAAQTSGTITFLFTDIEGSTRLLDKMGELYAVALAEHHEIMRSAIQKWNGREMDTQGDAFFVTFIRALDAMQCAAEAQRALLSHTWPQNESLRVRMGLHTGEPLIASTGYVGMDVHRAARIGDAGHGGQILLSHTTRELVAQDLPQGFTIRDLGEHRLKDMKYPASIYQLAVEGLPVDFAPLRTRFSGTEMPTPGEAPFMGLQFFDVDDSDLFFGREALTAKLVNRLSNANFLSVIIGASGSGKSSLVRAGLVPALKQRNILRNGANLSEGNAHWQVHIVTPTAHPLEALAIELTRDSESVTAAATLVDDLFKEPRSLHFFLSRQTQFRDLSAAGHTLLVIDQFEELFTLCRDEFEREAYIDNLLTALTPAGEEHRGEGLTLIITLRADFYAHLAQYPELRDAVAQQQEYVGPMTTEELRCAIEEPARRGHWEFEPGLVDLILRDVGDEPGALPLLSHALLETWKRRAGHVLTLKGYADAGGVLGAIAHTAESVYQNLSPDEQIIVRNILLRLTEFGEGTEDTRRRASFDELMLSAENADEVRMVLNKLAEARLVTLSENSAEVAHEALIREWPQLREWLLQDRESIILHRRLTEAAQEWVLLERDADMLYRGARLAQAREWAVLHPTALNTGEKAFLDASNMLEQNEIEEREAQQRRELEAVQKLAETEHHAAQQLQRRALFLTGALVLALILAGFAVLFQTQAKRNAITAASRELAAAAISNLDVDPELSLLLALQAEGKTHTVEADNALHRSIMTSRVKLVLPHGFYVWDVAFSPDGKQIASGGRDKTVKIWEANTGQLLMALPQTAEVLGLAYSPDGTRVAAALYDNTASIWDVTTGKELRKLVGHTAGLVHVAFSPDGTRLVTSSYDKTAKVWDANTGQELLTFSGHEAEVITVAFSPEGKRIASGGQDGLVRIWDSNSGKELLSLQTDGATRKVAFSPDGKRVAAVNDGLYPVMIWDAVTGKLLLRGNLGHSVPPLTIAFSPDGKLAVTSGPDQKAKVWDSTTGEVLITLSGHTQQILGATFSPDGKEVATASNDGTVRIWDITPLKELLFIPFANPENGWNEWLSYSPDGKHLLADYTDPNGRIWDAVTGKGLMQLNMHTTDKWVTQPSYSPDGKWVAAGSDDGKLILWDAQTGEQKLELAGHTGFIRHTAFSPDGTHLASVSETYDTSTTDPGIYTLIVFDLVSGKALFTTHGNSGGISAVAYSPDGKHIVTSDVATAVIWDSTRGEKVLTLQPDSQAVLVSVAYSPDGKYIATGDVNGLGRIWNASTGKEALTLKGHNGWLNQFSFSPDGKLIATVAKDGTARLWDLSTGENLLTLPVDSKGAGGVSFSPDGKRLAVGAYSGIYIFALPIEDVIALAKSRLTRTLTTEACQQYLHMSVCPPMP